MPRQARIDYARALHHVIVRGIERRRIFQDAEDYRDFLRRLGTILEDSSTPCYAWALLSNHFHLLLATGKRPLSKVMQSLLTGYVGRFNRRHARRGRLFENRYKSILCDRDTYLLELVRYIHLNPLRAGVVRSMAELDDYPWGGHRALMGGTENGWQATEEVLQYFASGERSARRAYRAFLEAGVNQGTRSDLTGGGLVRSYKGWHGVLAARRGSERLAGDERILGEGGFVERVLQEAREHEMDAVRLKRKGWTEEKVMARAAEAAGIRRENLSESGKRPAQALGRALACVWLVEDLRVRASRAAELLGISRCAVSRSLERGRRLLKTGKFELENR